MVHLIPVVLLMEVVILIVLIIWMMLVITNITGIFDHIHTLAPCVEHLILCGGLFLSPTVGANVLTCFRWHLTMSVVDLSSLCAPLVGDLQGPLMLSQNSILLM